MIGRLNVAKYEMAGDRAGLTVAQARAMHVDVESTLELERKFLHLRMPVTVGSYFGEWRVTWAGGWTKHRLSYLVMVVRPARGNDSVGSG